MVLLIGNSGFKSKSSNGQFEKVRLYKKVLELESISFKFIELENFKKHLISTVFKIIYYFFKSNRVILLTAQRGCKLLIPLLSFLNIFVRRKIVLPMIGINILHKYVDNLPEDEYRSFMNCCFGDIKAKKRDKKRLSLFECILPENESVSRVVSDFFELTNVRTLQNFRIFDNVQSKTSFNYHRPLKLIFISRITEKKGIFVLLEAINYLINNRFDVTLDIYGDLLFENNNSKVKFYKLLSNRVVFRGLIANYDVINTIKNYDVFIFPTLYFSEGTPGVISESLIAGVPVISSRFVQVSSILEENVDSLIFEQGNVQDLIEKILTIYNNSQILEQMSLSALKHGCSFSYHANRHIFLEFVCGIKNN